MTDLPLLLAGPMVRQCGPDHIWLFIVTSAALRLDIRLFPVTDPATTCGKGESARAIFSRGKVYLNIVKVLPFGKLKQFPENSLLSYELLYRTGDGPATKLDLSHLAVKPDQHPAIKLVLHTPAEILFGSCRKLGGEGRDSGHVADQLLAKARLAEAQVRSTKRKVPDGGPSALVLVGDQVYADDIKKDLAGLLKTARYLLFGGPRTGSAAMMAGPNPSHINDLEEALALYLLSWGMALWRTILPSSEVRLLDKFLDNRARPYGVPPRFIERLTIMRTVRCWERLFANLPTYMLLDDHEVADDWNLDTDWLRKTSSVATDALVASAGLAAYALFQGLGNDPENPAMTQLCRLAAQLDEGTAKAFLQEATRPGIFSFVGTAPFPILFLDTRTARTETGSIYEISTDPGSLPQRIVKHIRRKWVSDEHVRQMLRRCKLVDGTLYLVTPAPLMGFWAVEQRKQFLPGSAEELDLEGWHDNLEGLVDFLDVLAASDIKRLVVLSGDVHYAFGVQASVEWHAMGRKIHILQCTSSPTKNEDFLGKIGSWWTGGEALTTRFWRQRNGVLLYAKTQGGPDSLPVYGSPHHLTEVRQAVSLGSGSFIMARNNIGTLKVGLASEISFVLSFSDEQGTIGASAPVTFKD